MIAPHPLQLVDFTLPQEGVVTIFSWVQVNHTSLSTTVTYHLLKKYLIPDYFNKSLHVFINLIFSLYFYFSPYNTDQQICLNGSITWY